MASRAGVSLTDTERRPNGAIVDYLKPAHTHFVDLIEPGLPPVFDHSAAGLGEVPCLRGCGSVAEHIDLEEIEPREA